jgi:hypothetical protein
MTEDDTEPCRHLASEQLDELEKLADQATPGPWAACTSYNELGAAAEGPFHEVLGDYSESRETWEDKLARAQLDAEFIAASREAVPRLIARVREFEYALQAMVK